MATNQFNKANSLLSLVKNLKNVGPVPLNYESLCAWVESYDWQTMDWESLLPAVEDQTDYARNILCLEPFEVVLIQWPPGVESAVHHHEGFWGAVVCLSGELENVAYEFKQNNLHIKEIIQAIPRGIVAEPDGTLHKIRNGSDSESLVTLHFYSPALADLDGLVLYDLPSGKRFTCNSLAPTASVALDPSFYHLVEPDAFEFVAPSDASHFHCNILPKPTPHAIEQMVSDYYAEHASVYDAQDFQVLKRSRYTSAIDDRIVRCFHNLNDIQQIKRVMHFACGTGRRAVSIRELAFLQYEMHGVDLCQEMADQAQKRGVQVEVASLIDIELRPHWSSFDAITLLYAFGHLPNRGIRMQILKTAHRMLRSGGQLIFDVFDAADPGEWGPDAIRQFEEQRLGSQGYEKGDVFYKRTKGEELAFMHYCDRKTLEGVILEAGFESVEMTIIGYDQNSGEEAETGKLFVVAKKA
jgi:ubiquinone/menaquinone biosynthesis C-methylase UbiE/predicted metal-dependent enzyme (double-stranded beta helix superfamily)